MDAQRRFEELYRAHADRVHAYARRRSDAAVADDVVAEVFLVAWRRLGEMPDEPFPWLLGVARRVLANRRRTDGRAAALRDRLAGSGPRHQAPDGSGTGPGSGDTSVLRALATLGERDRELLLLIAWEGLGQPEVAEVLGLRPGTVSVRLHRARRRLADALAAQGDDFLVPMEVRR
jgi:RNA polymerase sigma-70 factor (ECF subfamily)